ncbi:MAG TPA: PLP-dependent transferase, partial [Alphaproteobacteria bacterium]|nr:PLP-dependent transferase [Alphaproteobacteria bacterium]
TSGQLFGQSSTVYNSMEAYIAGNAVPSLFAKEYGVVGTEDSVALAQKINQLYKGRGAVITPSGMAAIHVAIGTVHHQLRTEDRLENFSILVPNNVYGPVTRLLNYGTYFREDQVIAYGANEESFEAAVVQAERNGKPARCVYIETPVSNLFDVHDLAFLGRRAKELGAISVMDNTFSTYLGCQPIKDHQIDIVIDAGTKYLGGYGDCPFGAVVCRDKKMAEDAAYFARVNGMSTLANGLAELALYRIGSADARMAQSYQSARIIREEIFEPMLGGKIDRILAYDPDVYPRHARHCTRGNGLFTVIFNDDVSEKQRNAFANDNPLLKTAASWGGHVTLGVPLVIEGRQAIRIHAGLEDIGDLKRAFQRAALAL